MFSQRVFQMHPGGWANRIMTDFVFEKKKISVSPYLLRIIKRSDSHFNYGLQALFLPLNSWQYPTLAKKNLLDIS